MKDKKTYFSVLFALAFVWFGQHFGPGVATGAQLMVYFSNYGFIGSLLMPLFSMLVAGFSCFLVLEIARKYNHRDYHSIYSEIVHPVPALPTVYTIFQIFFGLIGIAGCMAGGATLLQGAFPIIPYWGWAAIVLAISLFLSIYGTEVIRKVSSGLSIAMISIIVIIAILALTSDKSQLSAMIASGGVEAQQKATLGQILWKGFTYGGFQSGGGFFIGSVMADHVKSRKESAIIALLAAGMNCLGMTAITMAIFAYSPLTYGSSLPLLVILEEIGIGSWFVWFYRIMVVAAVFSSVICFNYVQVARFSPYLKSVKTEKSKAIIISVVFLSICAATSLFGFIVIIQKGYTALATGNLIITLVPLWTLGARKVFKNKSSNKLENTQ